MRDSNSHRLLRRQVSDPLELMACCCSVLVHYIDIRRSVKRKKSIEESVYIFKDEPREPEEWGVAQIRKPIDGPSGQAVFFL